jgi:enterochelin esterase-like enzyme
VRRLNRVVLVTAVLSLAAASATWGLTRSTPIDLDEQVPSTALAAKVHALVVLPPGYKTSGLRYPVVYFLHGLPANADSYRANAWIADALARTGQAILVLPQGARSGDRDPEYLNWGAGRNWETYIAKELPRYIDAHYRTIRARSGRAIMGLSAGGYGATIVGLHHPGTFSVIESWSGYFHPTDPTGTRPLAREPATSAHTLTSIVRRSPTYFAFYVGRGDTRFLAENEQLDRELSVDHVPHVFEIYRGAHESSLWQTHAVTWLRLALRHLAPATR